jgi:TM2 domain-containing membrane protein YozV
MNCAYHSTSPANAHCRACRRGLCLACAHRIKGYPYCQDCIVAGVEQLKHGAAWAQQPTKGLVNKSPLAAALLALVPGLGAAYNGQIVKALVHFTLAVGLWQLADIFDSVLFCLGGIGFYFYSVYDAFNSARRLRAGEDLSGEDEQLKKLLREKTGLWAGLLITVGALSMLHFLFHDAFIERLWPLAFIGGGLYLLHSHRRGHRPASQPPASAIPPPPTSAAPYDPAYDYTRAEARRFDR